MTLPPPTPSPAAAGPTPPRPGDPIAGPLFDTFARIGQAHVFGLFGQLDEAGQARLIEDLAALSVDQVLDLAARAGAPPASRPPGQVAPPLVREQATDTASVATERAAVARGERALREGAVAALVVAGGQASRLGIDRPKGCLAVGPITGRSLFEIFAKQLRAGAHVYGRPIPWLVMTSPATHRDTVAFFEQHAHFGLDPADVRFFQQGTLPAFDPAGRLCLAAPDRLFASPDGHGGVLPALRNAGLLDWLGERGVDTISYFQVDNLQARILDPQFIGAHLLDSSEFSAKVIAKTSPDEKVGVLVRRPDADEAAEHGGGHARHGMIEYSDMSAEDRAARDPDGRLTYRAGNPAIHLLDVPFLRRITDAAEGEGELPLHRAHKSVPHLDPAALTEGRAEPAGGDAPNAYKFERFIFDALPLARRATLLQVGREAEFLPIKSAAGPTSPGEVAKQYQRYWGAQLLALGYDGFTLDADGLPSVVLEIDPLYMLDTAVATRLRQRLSHDPPRPVDGSLFVRATPREQPGRPE